MDDKDWLAERFEEHRPRLRAVAYRMLGSTGEADDAVQETWIRLSRSSADEIDNLEAWLVTVVGRVALNLLRARATRREESLDARLPDPVVDRADATDPEQEALIADSVGLALLVVLETLTPAERLSYVLHDMFSVPFEEIGAIVGRSPEAARQLASRGRRRIRDADTTPDTSAAEQRAVVTAFLAAAREGNFDALVAVLDPDVVVREDNGRGPLVLVRGAASVAGRALAVSRLGLDAGPALVNGAIGFVSRLDGEVYAIAAVSMLGGRITRMDILLDRARLARIDISGRAAPRQTPPEAAPGAAPAGVSALAKRGDHAEDRGG